MIGGAGPPAGAGAGAVRVDGVADPVADVAQPADLRFGQRIEDEPARLGDVPRRGGGDLVPAR